MSNIDDNKNVTYSVLTEEKEEQIELPPPPGGFVFLSEEPRKPFQKKVKTKEELAIIQAKKEQLVKLRAERKAKILKIATGVGKVTRNTLVATAIIAGISGAVVGIDEVSVLHNNKPCLYAKIVGLFDKEIAINHMINEIEKDNPHCQAKYVTGYSVTLPENCTLKDGKLIHTIEPLKVYSIPEGYERVDDYVVKYDGNGDIVDKYILKPEVIIPDGYTLAVDENGKDICIREYDIDVNVGPHIEVIEDNQVTHTFKYPSKN